MHCLWQGQVIGVHWPHHEPKEAELSIELWWPHKSLPAEFSGLQTNSKLHYSKYVRFIDLPLWAISGSEIQILSRSNETKTFFSEFSALEQSSPIGMLLQINSEDSTNKNLLIYPVMDSMDKSFKLFGRILDTSHPDAIRPTLQSVESPLQNGNLVNTTAKSAEPPLGAKRQSSKNVNIKGMIQHMIIAALRLRGFDQADPDFKELYWILLRSTTFAIKKLPDEMINMELIRSKVEGILAVIE